jgi:hypothetical protein
VSAPAEKEHNPEHFANKVSGPPDKVASLLDDLLIALLDLPGDAWPDLAAALPDELFKRLDRWMD